MAGGIVGTPAIRFDVCGGSLVVLIIATIFFEIGTQMLHKRFASDQASTEMLHKLELELMILGFLSFFLVMSNEYNMPWIPNASWFHALEFAHILLFYAACGLMLRAVTMRNTLSVMVKNMDRLEREDIHDTLAKFLEAQTVKENFVQTMRRKVLGSAQDNPRWDLQWQIMRKVVPRKPDFREHHRTCEVDDDFDFARYCELILQRDIVHSVHISGPIWGVVGLVGFIVMLGGLDFDAGLDFEADASSAGMLAAGMAAGGAVVVAQAPGTCAACPCDWAMPTVDPPPTPAGSGAAAAVFGGGTGEPLSATNLIEGSIAFIPSPAGAAIPSDDVEMVIDLRWNSANLAVGGANLGWHIHEKPAGATSSDCGAGFTGGHYIPECTAAGDACPNTDAPGAVGCDANPPASGCAGVTCATALAGRSGELSARYGSLCDGLSTCLMAADAQPLPGVGNPTTVNVPILPATKRQVVRLQADTIVRLAGPRSVVGRSIVIHGVDGQRIACATIEPALALGQPAAAPCTRPEATNQDSTVATAEFGGVSGGEPNSPVTGSLTFTEELSTGSGSTGGSVTTIRLNLVMDLPAEVGGWHVHVSPIDETGATTSEQCGTTGGHYDPECFGSANRVGVGELTHRHGPLTSAMVDGTTWTDSNLPLSGPNSIVGRSIVIHAADGSRIACANIVDEPAAGRRQLARNTSSPAARPISVRPRPNSTSSSGPEPRVVRSNSAVDWDAGRDTSWRRLAGTTGEVEPMPTSEAWTIVMIMLLWTVSTTVFLHVLLHFQHRETTKLLKYRGWHSDDDEVLRKCVEEILSAKQMDDTAIEVEHGEHHGLDEHGEGGHDHASHDGIHGLCALSGYTAKEKRENFVMDALITLNCFYTSFCVLYGVYATGWTGVGVIMSIFLDILLFVPALYQFFTVGPAIARDRAMLTAYIHLDESLLREVEVYTARTSEIKAQLCEKVLQKLSKNKVGTSTMSQPERAARATEFFMEYDIDAGADGMLSADELEKAIVGLRLVVTHNEIKQLIRELDIDQSGSVDATELERFLVVNMDTGQMEKNAAAARPGFGRGDSQAAMSRAPPPVAPRPDSGEMDGMLRQLDDEARRSRQLEDELRRMQDENSQLRTRGQPLPSAAVSGGGGAADPGVLAEMTALAEQVQQLQEDKSRLTKRMKAMSAESAPPMAAAGSGRRSAPALATLPGGRSGTPVHASAPRKAPPPLPAKSVVFNQYDKDQSGELDATEVRALLRARGVSVGGAAFDQMLAKYDVDGDGTISVEEFNGLYEQLAAQAQRRSAPRATRAGSRRGVGGAAGGGSSSRI